MLAGGIVGGFDGVGRKRSGLRVGLSSWAMDWDAAGGIVGGFDESGRKRAGLRVGLSSWPMEWDAASQIDGMRLQLCAIMVASWAGIGRFVELPRKMLFSMLTSR